MAIETSLLHWFPLKNDGNDIVGTASPSVSSVTFTGSHASFTASASSFIHWGNIFNVGTSNLTMAGWVYVNSYAGSGHQGAVFSKACSSLNAQTGSNLQFYNSQSRAQVGSGGTSTTATTSLPSAGAWHHIALTRDGTTIKQYIDGVLVDTQTSASVYNITSAASNTFLTAGAIRVPGGSYWQGGLDGNLNDLLAYDRALSAAEIASIHGAGQGNFSSLIPLGYKLQAYYECNSAADTMGNHPATLASVSVGSGTGKFGDSWDFASIASYISLATPTPNTVSMTAMAWGYNLRAGSNYRSLFFNGTTAAPNDGLQFVTEASTELAGTYASGFTSTGTALASGSYTGWHHYAVVKNGATFTFYVDGVSIGSITPTWPATTSTQIKEIGGRSAATTQGFAERLDDVAVWTRPLTTAEINQIYSAGNPLSSLIPGPAILKGMFGSLVHDAPPDVAVLEGMFGSLVHDAPPNVAKLEGMFGSLVHDAPPDAAVLEGMFGSIVHDIPPPAAICPDITGSPGVPATFDGSASTTTTYYHWSWVSVPGGSTIANAAIPFPDSGATTPINMTGNLGLWHFDTLNSVSTPTGSIGLIDTYGDGWHGSNFASVSVGGVAVLTNITLPDPPGNLQWFDYAASPGVAVSVTFTPGYYPTECKYDLNDATGGTGTTFYSSGTNPATYNFTAGTFASATSYNTPDTSGGSRTLQVHGATQATGKIGTHCLSFDGTNDYLIYEAADVFPGTTNAISISFWQYGDVGLANNVIIWGQDASANRVVNIHMPYSGQIYFDCGNTGASYDRINKAAVAGDYSGAWAHWVFTKDVSTGTMSIYRNGALWHSGTGNTKTLSAISKFYVGAGETGGVPAQFYDGKIDEVAVWSRVLGADEIATIYAAQNGALAGIGTSTFTFTPDIVGTYRINLAVNATTNTNADCVVTTPSPGGGGPPGQGGNSQGYLLQGGVLEGDI